MRSKKSEPGDGFKRGIPFVRISAYSARSAFKSSLRPRPPLDKDVFEEETANKRRGRSVREVFFRRFSGVLRALGVEIVSARSPRPRGHTRGRGEGLNAEGAEVAKFSFGDCLACSARSALKSSPRARHGPADTREAAETAYNAEGAEVA